ncbi:hypothetical protein THAOC_11491, partial [Thalassiosira oceanica]
DNLAEFGTQVVRHRRRPLGECDVGLECHDGRFSSSILTGGCGIEARLSTMRRPDLNLDGQDFLGRISSCFGLRMRQSTDSNGGQRRTPQSKFKIRAAEPKPEEPSPGASASTVTLPSAPLTDRDDLRGRPARDGHAADARDDHARPDSARPVRPGGVDRPDDEVLPPRDEVYPRGNLPRRPRDGRDDPLGAEVEEAAVVPVPRRLVLGDAVRPVRPLARRTARPTGGGAPPVREARERYPEEDDGAEGGDEGGRPRRERRGGLPGVRGGGLVQAGLGDQVEAGGGGAL